MSILKDLFTFPTIMMDGYNEEKKEKEKEKLDVLGIGKEEEDFDIVYGEAEYPHYDFVGIEDRWEPDRKSFEKALKGKFNACLVKFANVGHLLVPWTKEKFKEELQKFIDNLEKEEEKNAPDRKVTVIKLTPDMLEGIIRKVDEQDTEQG